MTTDEYNGWPNRETWAAALHLNNDERLYRSTAELARQYLTDAHDDDAADPIRRATWRLAERLADWAAEAFEAVYHDPGAATDTARMMAADVGSLWRVEWETIAEGWIEEAAAERAEA